jgi:hypothetical protein
MEARKASSRGRGWEAKWIGLATVLALFLALGLWMPTAHITLNPQRERMVVRFDLPLAAGTSSEQLGMSLGTRLAIVRKSGEAQGVVEGSTKIPDHFAEGVVIFTNQSQEPVRIPLDTSVRTAEGWDVRFQTMRAIELPGRIGAYAEAPVQAVEPGTSGNVPPGSISRVDGPLGLLLTVSNPAALSGGSEIERGVVTNSDLERLEVALSARLLEDACDGFAEELSKDERLIRGSCQIYEVVEREFDHHAGEVAEELGLLLSVDVSGRVYLFEDLAGKASKVIDAILSNGRGIVPGSMEGLLTVAPLREDFDKEFVQVSAELETYESPLLPDLQESLRGKKVAQATELLASQLRLSAPPRLELQPTWMPILPIFSGRISLDIGWGE